MSKKKNLYYYNIDKDGAVTLTHNYNKIPSTSAVNFRRLVHGSDDPWDGTEIQLTDPFTVTVRGIVVFRLKSQKWIAKVTQHVMTKA